MVSTSRKFKFKKKLSNINDNSVASTTMRYFPKSVDGFKAWNWLHTSSPEIPVFSGAVLQQAQFGSMDPKRGRGRLLAFHPCGRIGR